MAETRIEWATKVWNPVTGCTPISEGCQHCYAHRMSKRLAGRCGYPKDNPFDVTLHPDKLNELLKWKKSSRIFVCSMGDLFHKDVPFEVIRCIWAEIAVNQNHIFNVLTKRPERALEFFQWMEEQEFRVESYLRNVLFGVTAENQQRADERITILRQIPVLKRLVSIEPMLGPVDIEKYLLPTCKQCQGTMSVPYLDDGGRPCPRCINNQGIDPDRLDWVICGGETGPSARPMHPDWVRSLRDQCQAAGTPFFFKSWGEWVNEDQTSSPYDRPYKVHHFEKNRVSKFGEKDPSMVLKMGKKKAGRLLDGVEWNEFPGVRA